MKRRFFLGIFSLFIIGCGTLFFGSKSLLSSGLSYSKAIYDDQQHLLRLTLNQEDKYRLFVPLKEISPILIKTTLLQEDQYFRWHFGINPFSLMKASWQTYAIKSRRVGASTITMQVARMRYGINSKSFSGKIKQLLRAMQLELYYSKDEILEAYLNLAPYGNNIEGVGAASLIYFNKPTSKVTLPEALTLTVIPQNPTMRTPRQKNLKEIRNKLFARWILKHPEDKSKKMRLDLPLQMQSLRALPFIAPHFVNAILQDETISSNNINTTLNTRLQKILEHVTRNYLIRKKSLGVNNGAVMLVDTRDMSIKALVGSADFFNSAIQGQINGTRTKRSPGSTLKPFIYGLALDQGFIHPNTVLKDVPHSFGAYNPENFDYEFMGPIKAKDALVLSRNIPAIFLGEKLQHPTLHQFLEEAQVSHLKPESYYGLALILGGAELSMNEISSLYAMLVNDGYWRPLRMRAEEKQTPGKQLLSAEASYLVLDMLKETRSEFSSRNNGTVEPIAWKTGTSSGYRDAWSVGTFGPYVLTVWIGNFNNTSNPSFIGKTIAAPLFFEIIDAVQQELHPPRLIKNLARLKLTKIPVCKTSGMMPTRFCKLTELTWFIPGKSPIKTDVVHREVAIDQKTGLRTCQFDKSTRFEIFEFWPSDLIKIFKTAGIVPRIPPPYNMHCQHSEIRGFSPEITSPKMQLSYIVRGSDHNKMEIPLMAIADADVAYLHWFINEAFLVKTSRDKIHLWNAKPGKYVIRVVDDHGRSDTRNLIIKVDS